MAGNTRAATRAQFAGVVDERRARIAAYKVRGFSIREICAALAGDGYVNPRTRKPYSIKVICEDLQHLRARWTAEALKDIGEHVSAELSKLDEIERQAWAAWQRGIGKRQQTFTEQVRGGRSGSRASVKTEEANGDPRYLAVLLDCQQRRARLLGLDAAVKVETTGKGGGPIKHEEVMPLSPEARAAKVAEILAAARARMAARNEEGEGDPGGTG